MPKVRSIFTTSNGPIVDPSDHVAVWVTVKIHRDLVFGTHPDIMEWVVEQIQKRKATIEDRSQHMRMHSRISIPVLLAHIPINDREGQYKGAEIIAKRFLEATRMGDVTLNLERIFPILKQKGRRWFEISEI
jgi:hypothetical protein